LVEALWNDDLGQPGLERACRGADAPRCTSKRASGSTRFAEAVPALFYGAVGLLTVAFLQTALWFSRLSLDAPTSVLRHLGRTVQLILFAGWLGELGLAYAVQQCRRMEPDPGLGSSVEDLVRDGMEAQCVVRGAQPDPCPDRRHRRFAFVRLPGPHLPQSYCDFSFDVHHDGS
jgi:hypothetical protein